MFRIQCIRNCLKPFLRVFILFSPKAANKRILSLSLSIRIQRRRYVTTQLGVFREPGTKATVVGL